MISTSMDMAWYAYLFFKPTSP